MKNMLIRIVAALSLVGILAGLAGCAGNYQPDPVRESRQTDIIRFMQSSSEGRGYY